MKVFQNKGHMITYYQFKKLEKNGGGSKIRSKWSKMRKIG